MGVKKKRQWKRNGRLTTGVLVSLVSVVALDPRDTLSLACFGAEV